MNELHPNFRQAICASVNSDHRQHKMGAAVFYKNQFLAAGFNSLKTHPFTHYYDHAYTRHAELHAVAKAKVKKFDLTNTSIYIFRQTKDGDIAMARPCQMCLDYLIMEGIKKVFFTNYGGWERLRL